MHQSVFQSLHDLDLHDLLTTKDGENRDYTPPPPIADTPAAAASSS